MAANMYAKSIFGEDVLANLSIEKPAHLPQNAPVQGHIRIRAKSQVNDKICYWLLGFQILLPCKISVGSQQIEIFFHKDTDIHTSSPSPTSALYKSCHNCFSKQEQCRDYLPA